MGGCFIYANVVRLSAGQRFWMHFIWIVGYVGLSYLTETFLGERKHGHLISQVIKMLDVYKVFFVCYTLVVL